MNKECQYCGFENYLKQPTKFTRTDDIKYYKKPLSARPYHYDNKMRYVFKQSYSIKYDTVVIGEYIFRDGINNYHCRCSNCGKLVYDFVDVDEDKILYEPLSKYNYYNKYLGYMPSTPFFVLGKHWSGNVGDNWPFESTHNEDQDQQLKLIL